MRATSTDVACFVVCVVCLSEGHAVNPCKPLNQKLYIRWEWGTLAPSDKYDGMICAAAAMRTAVAITVATWLLATCYVYVHSLLYIIWRNVFDNVIDNFSRP